MPIRRRNEYENSFDFGCKRAIRYGETQSPETVAENEVQLRP